MATTRESTTREAPIPRAVIDELRPYGRAILGLLFVGYSARSTVSLCASDLLWLFEGTREITIYGFPDAYWYSGLLALLLFAGEVMTSEKYPRTYWLFLIPDTFYTARGLWGGLFKASTVLAGSITSDGTIAQVIGFVAATAISAYLGYMIAKWGEVLLFGNRRRIKRGE